MPTQSSSKFYSWARPWPFPSSSVSLGVSVIVVTCVLGSADGLLVSGDGNWYWSISLKVWSTDSGLVGMFVSWRIVYTTVTLWS